MHKTVRVFLYRYGDAALLKNYMKALNAVGMEYLVSDRMEESAACGALLLSGGHDSDPRLYGQENRDCCGVDLRRDLVELALVRAFAGAQKPILGICRGHQLLNFAFGGDLIQDLPTKERHVERRNRDQLHRTNISEKSFLYPLYGASAIVTSAHHQAVGRLGTGLRSVQRAEDGVVEALVHVRLPIFGVQWHPERQNSVHPYFGAADGGALFSFFKAICQMQCRAL